MYDETSHTYTKSAEGKDEPKISYFLFLSAEIITDITPHITQNVMTHNRTEQKPKTLINILDFDLMRVIPETHSAH